MMAAPNYQQIFNCRVRPSTTPSDQFWVPSPDHLVLIKLRLHHIFACCYGSPPSSLDLGDLNIARKVEKRGAMAMEVPLGALLDITREENTTHLLALTQNFSDMGVPKLHHGGLIADACHIVKSALFDDCGSATPPPPPEIDVKAKALTLQFGEDDGEFEGFERIVEHWDCDSLTHSQFY